LVTAIASARVALVNIIVSTDGTDVFADQRWATQEAIDSLKAAIDSAQIVLDNQDARQPDIEAATAALSNATATFINTAIRIGSKAHFPPDTQPTRLGTPTSGESGSRHKTMKQIVEAFIDVDGTKPDTVILAKSNDFPDALSVAGFAGLYNAPILTSSPSYLTQETAELLKEIQPAKVYVLGDEQGSFTKDVLDSIYQIVPHTNIQRLSGTNRFATALEIYYAGTQTQSGWSKVAIIARGDNFADALSMSAFAWATHSPIFLANPDTGLDAAALGALGSGDFEKIYVLGAENSVPQAVVTQLADRGITGYKEATSVADLEQSAGTRIVRLAGTSRYQTSVLIAEEAVAEASRLKVSLGHNNTLVAKGTDFPDALAGGAFAGKLATTLVLVNPETGRDNHVLDSYLSVHKQEIGSLYVLGDNNAIPEALLALIAEARQG
jgi:putative cell wall-binding protein